MNQQLIYICNQRLPTEKAYGIQIAKMCEVFSHQDLNLTLLVPYRQNTDKEFFNYYHIKKSFTFKRLWSPDFYLSGKFDQLAVGVKNFISGVVLTLYTLRHPPDVVYSREELPLYILSFFRKGIFFEAHRFAQSREFFYRRFLKTGMKIVVISQGIKDAFIQFGFLPDRILVAHDGVDIEQFDLSIPKEQARTELELPQNTWLVGYVGQLKTLGMSKGLDLLMEGFSSFHRKHPNSTLVIVGGASEDIRELQRLSQNFRIPSDAIIFAGRQSHGSIPKYLKALDVLVMTYPNQPHFANFMSPLKLFEYMASRRPIVTSDLPTIREVLNEDGAFMIRSDNSRAIAQALEDIFSHPKEAQQKAEQARSVVEQYSWRIRAQHILSFLS